MPTYVPDKSGLPKSPLGEAARRYAEEEAAYMTEQWAVRERNQAADRKREADAEAQRVKDRESFLDGLRAAASAETVELSARFFGMPPEPPPPPPSPEILALADEILREMEDGV